MDIDTVTEQLKNIGLKDIPHMAGFVLQREHDHPQKTLEFKRHTEEKGEDGEIYEGPLYVEIHHIMDGHNLVWLEMDEEDRYLFGHPDSLEQWTDLLTTLKTPLP